MFFMDRHVIEVRARQLSQARKRQARAEQVVLRILGILNLRWSKDPPKARRGRYGDLGMDYDTLFECEQALAELMDSWLAARCDLRRWPLKQQFESDMNNRELFLQSGGDGVQAGFTGPVRGKSDLLLGVGYEMDASPGQTLATSLFFQFVCGPFWRDLGRCKRCRRYFLNLSGHADKVYCNGRCASAVTATETTRRRRAQEYKTKIEAVCEAIAAFEKLSKDRKDRHNWKRWVARRAGGGITQNFLTRAVNKGEFRAPTG